MQVSTYTCRMGVLFAYLVGSVALRAQQPTNIQKEDGGYTLREGTHLVLLDVAVTDSHGHPVTGLTKDDFKLLEDGRSQSLKFFEEHVPIDSAEIARQKAAAVVSQPPSTFTHYEPFSGRPVTVLLLNELLPLPAVHVSSLRQEIINVLKKSPPDTPFSIYVLDSNLRLVQPVTTDRALLMTRINEIEMPKNMVWKDPIKDADTRPKTGNDLMTARRQILTTAMQQLAAGLKDVPGRKDLIAFTQSFQCTIVSGNSISDYGSSPYPSAGCPVYDNDREFLCGLMDTLEQGRMSIYRHYYNGEVNYGLGCGSTEADVPTGANYYTLYYTSTNSDWDGKYRAIKLGIAGQKGLRLAYRKGYLGTPDSTKAHY